MLSWGLKEEENGFWVWMRPKEGEMRACFIVEWCATAWGGLAQALTRLLIEQSSNSVINDPIIVTKKKKKSLSHSFNLPLLKNAMLLFFQSFDSQLFGLSIFCLTGT